MKVAVLPSILVRFALFIVLAVGLIAPISQGADLPEKLATLFTNHCVDCHDGEEAEGGLNLRSLEWNLEDSHVTGIWVKIHDRVKSGEMPPKESSDLNEAERGAAVKELASRIDRFQTKRYALHGRAVSRRVNRFEYENILRDLLHDPYLKIADQLPLDGEIQGFAKVGEALDVSHVQVEAYLDAAEFAFRRALEFPAEQPKPTTKRYYARESGRMWAGKGNGGWARFSLALEGLKISDEYSFDKKGFAPVKQVKPTKDAGITVDDVDAELTGPWRKSTRRSNHVGDHYLADDNKNTGAYAITWKAKLPKPGIYEVRVSFGGGEGLARTAPYRVRHAEGESDLSISQRQKPTIEGLWFPLGRFTFEHAAEVSLSNKDAGGWVIADAVQFVHVDDLKGNPKRKRGADALEPAASALPLRGNQVDASREDTSTAIFRGAYTPFYYGFDKFKAPVRGDYKLRLKARSVLRQTDYVDWEGEKKPRHYPNLVLDATRRYPTPVNDRVFAGKRSEPVKVYSSTLDEPNTQSMLPIGIFEAPPESPEVSELTAFLEKGAMVKLDCMRLPSPMVPAMPHTIQKTNGGYPGVAFHWLEVEGPIVKQWPPASYRALFGDVPFQQKGRHVEAVSKQPLKDAERLLAAFMERAYRRPVAKAEFDRFYEYAKQLLKEDETFTEAMIATYSAVLASPKFLFHCGVPGELDDFALAERLSFFLSESMPDDRLRALARQGKLRDPDTLRSQVDRLLGKPEAKRFVKEFLNSWLKIDEINDTDPDRELYPEYAGDWWLVNSMVEESRLYFADLIARDQPARNVIDADYTFLDERLARHYGVPGVFGAVFQRTSLPENSPYGGTLTQASVLKVTANGTVTSPVLRGVYVMERLLGDPPSPPPPSVPAVEPDIRGAATIRELLKKHRADASCASCHQKIDPPGFALESFDVMGRWRDNYRSLTQGSQRIEGVGRSGNEFVHYIGKEVDASGVTPGGEPFDDILQFKKLLLQDEEAIARNLTEQLVVYATGAPVGFADRDDVSAILEKCRASEFGVRSIIHEITQSPLFLNK
jgi:mono/diheme cytochrome c family protein